MLFLKLCYNDTYILCCSFDSMNQLCQRYNKAIRNILSLVSIIHSKSNFFSITFICYYVLLLYMQKFLFKFPMIFIYEDLISHLLMSALLA